MKTTYLVSLGLTSLVLLNSCSQDDEPTVKNLDKDNFVSRFDGTKWSITSIVADVERIINGDTSTNWYSIYSDCRKDDVYIFDFSEADIDNYEINIDEGSLGCGTELAFIDRAFTMEFNSDFSEANIANKREGALTKLYDLDKIDDERFVVHTWKIMSASQDEIKFEVSIPDSEDFKMIEGGAIVDMVFEKVE